VSSPAAKDSLLPGALPTLTTLPPELLLIDRLNVGVVTVTEDLTVVQWNRFLAAHSGRGAGEVIGENLLSCFPELPGEWLLRKIRSVFLLKTFAFTSWRQRPYLFHFQHHRLVTGGRGAMRQDCAMVPLIEDGVVKAVSIVLIDATDACESEARLDEALSELSALSVRDALTGVFNRRKIEEVLDGELQRLRRYGGECGVLMLDIDHFKRVNDSHGHVVGDEAIRHVAQLACKTLRNTDVVGRYGGEEFVAVLPEVGLVGAATAAERLRQAIASTPVHHPDVTFTVTVSIGVTAMRPEVKDRTSVVESADRALYLSKSGGRNRVTSCVSDGEEPVVTPRR
jgi:diguanylate cyclase (GGDEF)-like protein